MNEAQVIQGGLWVLLFLACLSLYCVFTALVMRYVNRKAQ